MADNVFAEGQQITSVNVDRSAVREIEAGIAHVDRSAIQRLHADRIDVNNAALGVVNSATTEISQSAAGIVAGDYVKVEDSRVMVLLAPRVSGNVTALITLPAAFAFGAGFFVARRVAKALFSRSDS